MLDKLYKGWRLVFILGTFIVGSVMYLTVVITITLFEALNYFWLSEKSYYADFPFTHAFLRSWLFYLLLSWAVGTLTGLSILLTKEKSFT